MQVHLRKSAWYILFGMIFVFVFANGIQATTTTLGATADSTVSPTFPVEQLLNADGTLNTRTGASGALDLRGWDVTLDSGRGPILTPSLAPAAPLTTTWSALSNDGLMNGEVFAIAVNGSDIYVGGDFSLTRQTGQRQI